jgi:phosphoglycolate phosphatase/putative hydrolase of the HAD superfamily
MDGTLYTNDEYLQEQGDCLIRRLARLRGKSFDLMKAETEAYQNGGPAAREGKKISLSDTLLAFGISIEENIRWREELIEPGRYVGEDPELRKTLLALGWSVPLALVTNNPVSVAWKTLACLGVSGLFMAVVGLDTCGVSKPHRAPYLKAAEILGVSPGECVSIGDRYDFDIALPLELGMGGILVGGVEDVKKVTDTVRRLFTC